VNTNNIKAINLYTKFGFVEYSRRKNYYGDNDAILMKLDV
jgi:ribosomal protein S18 acetylase RimI-like enzyme